MNLSETPKAEIYTSKALWFSNIAKSVYIILFFSYMYYRDRYVIPQDCVIDAYPYGGYREYLVILIPIAIVISFFIYILLKKYFWNKKLFDSIVAIFFLSFLVIRILMNYNYQSSYVVNGISSKLRHERLSNDIYIHSIDEFDDKMRDFAFADSLRKEDFINKYFGLIFDARINYEHLYFFFDSQTLNQDTQSTIDIKVITYTSKIIRVFRPLFHRIRIFVNGWNIKKGSIRNINLHHSVYPNTKVFKKIFKNPVIVSYHSDGSFIHDDIAWMHELTEGILGLYFSLDDDIFVRWTKDGLADFFAERYYLCKNNFYLDEKEFEDLKSNMLSDNVDILAWKFDNELPDNFENLGHYYARSVQFFIALEERYGYQVIEDLLNFMHSAKKLLSEDILLFLENRIGKEGLSELIGERYIERVKEYRMTYFRKVFEENKNNLKLLKSISSKNYISAPDELKGEIRKYLSGL